MKRLLTFLVLTCFIQNSFGQSIAINKWVENDSIFLDFINPFYAPMEINLSPLDSTKSIINVKSHGLLRYKDTLKKAIAIPLNHITDTITIDTKEYVNFKANFGDPNSKVDETYRYSLPYPKRKKYKIVQSFGGKFSHNKPHSRYAIDFGMAIGDTITAARDGIVFFVKEDSDEHCRNRKCVSKGNKVLILHDDGTMAHYVHLDFEGAIVEVGDKVKVGQPIAISGMTGFTTTPHLHLVMYKSGGISIPFYIKGQKRKKLKQGRYYLRRQ